MSILSHLFSLLKTKAKVSSVDSKINGLIERNKKSAEEVISALSKLKSVEDNCTQALENARKALVAIEKKYQAELEKTRLTLRNSQTMNVQLEEGMSALRDELKTLNDITIPGLVAANRLFIDRWESESKIHIMRTAFVDPRKEE